MIYYLQSGPEDLIKIGYTRANVGMRFQAARLAGPYEVVFLGAHAGDANVEDAIHYKFQKFQFRGEWFYPDPSIVQYIERYAEFTTLDHVLRVDLRDAVRVGARKHWDKVDKTDYIEQIRDKYPRIVGMWTGGQAVLPDAVAEELETFLRERDLLPTEAAQ